MEPSTNNAHLSDELSSLNIESKTANEGKLTDVCAACGKEGDGDSLKACTACKMVKYCNRDCQIAHRPQHKKACKKRAKELYDEALFADPPPPEECPICFLTLPFDEKQCTFQSCCGKTICNGCICGMLLEHRRRGKGKEEELGICAFCRELPKSDQENIERYKKLMEKGNAEAYNQLAGFYAFGTMGFPQDYTKANELFLKAGELGLSDAYHNLGIAYEDGIGVEMDKKKAKHFYELAAMGGNAKARLYLACLEGQAGNEQRANKHIIIAATLGYKVALDKAKDGVLLGFITKDEYEQILRAYQKRHNEAKSDLREKAVLLTDMFPK